jgi:hypothetical protein
MAVLGRAVCEETFYRSAEPGFLTNYRLYHPLIVNWFHNAMALLETPREASSGDPTFENQNPL